MTPKGRPPVPDIALDRSPADADAAPRPPWNGRLFLVLWGAGTISGLALAPVLVMASEAGLREEKIGWGMAILASFLGPAVLYAVAVFIGLRLGPRLGLRAPLVEGWLAGRPVAAGPALGLGAIAGGVLGLAGVALSAFLAGTAVAAAPGGEVMPAWTGLANAVSAGIGEELLFRLGLMSLVAWLAARLLPGTDGAPTPLGMWLAIGVTAILFELTHIDPPAEITQVAALAASALQAMRITLAVALGWLFWRRGLEAAMAAHFTYNMILFYGVVAVL